MAEDQWLSAPACLQRALAGCLETLERGRSGAEEPALGLSVGKQWEPGRGAAQRLCLEAWKGGACLSGLGPVACSWGLLAECGMFWGKRVGSAEGSSSLGQSADSCPGPRFHSSAGPVVIWVTDCCCLFNSPRQAWFLKKTGLFLFFFPLKAYCVPGAVFGTFTVFTLDKTCIVQRTKQGVGK